jgi:putative addiction module antidote
LRPHPNGITFVITSAVAEETGMPKQTTIRAIGNSAGTTIPKAMLDRYQLREGDSVYLVETPDGILVTPYDPGFKEAMELYEEGAKRYRNAMRELAK